MHIYGTQIINIGFCMIQTITKNFLLVVVLTLFCTQSFAGEENSIFSSGGKSYEPGLYGVNIGDKLEDIIRYCADNNFDCKIEDNSCYLNTEDMNNNYPFVLYKSKDGLVNEIHFVKNEATIERQHISLYKHGLGLEERREKNGSTTSIYIDKTRSYYVGFKSIGTEGSLIGAIWSADRFNSMYGKYDEISKNKNVLFLMED